jgi:hypothetical protein
VRSFANATYWGSPFFPEGYPYLLSLYVGVPVLVLAACGRETRLVVLAVLGTLLALGDKGPLRFALAPWLVYFRVPVKFSLLATLAIALLAGRGLERALGSRLGRATFIPGGLLVAGAAGLAWRPEAAWSALGGWVPELATPAGRTVVSTLWPSGLAASGALALLVALALCAGRRWALLAAAAVVADLLAANAWINRAAPARFYELRPEVRPLVETVAAAAPARVFSYGVGYSGGVPWAKAVAAFDDDAWLYYLDRQSLLPRTFVLDGLEGAYEPDRTGWAPAGASLSVEEARSRALPRVAERLLRANVRFVFSFEPLPPELARERARASLPEVLVPLRLYELAGAWPRAFFVPSLDSAPQPPSPETHVEYRREGPHSLTIRARTPPGFVAVLDGYDPGWRARSDGAPVPLQRFSDRYWAIGTPGGEKIFDVSFEPGWRGPSLELAGLGLLLLALLSRRGAATPSAT